MLNALRQGRVDGLRITVACARSLDEVPLDVYLLDLEPTHDTDRGGDGGGDGGGGRFDEVPYLEALEPVLDAAGGPPSWVVEVARSHGSSHSGVGRAALSVLLGIGAASPPAEPDPDLTPVVRAAFGRMLPAGGASADTPSRDEALAAAAASVVQAFPGTDAAGLALTDEEHHAEERRWTVGLAVPGVARFRVQLGFVPGAPTSAHVRRMPPGEVVDSVGP